MSFDSTYELSTRYDARQSFYGKAQVLTNGDTLTLRSYSTDVAQISRDDKGERIAKVFGTYSPTTLRHIKEFLKQERFKADSKAQIENDYISWTH